ncbi:unnamed protein product [Aphanomyces euteiches]
MRVVLFLVLALSVFGWGQPVARLQVNRVLRGQLERRWRRKVGNIMEIVGGAAGNAIGTTGSITIGTVTGGNIGTRAGRSGMAAGTRIMGEYMGGHFGGKAGSFLGRQADKLTSAGRQAQAAAKNRKKDQAEALKKPVLYTGGEYQKAKLSRTGSSPALLQRNNASPGGRKPPMNPGQASTSGSKPVSNKGKAPMNPSSASTSGGQSPRHVASTSGTKPAINGGKASASVVKSPINVGGQGSALRKRKL